jgi:hypothetical protein
MKITHEELAKFKIRQILADEARINPEFRKRMVKVGLQRIVNILAGALLVIALVYLMIK